MCSKIFESYFGGLLHTIKYSTMKLVFVPWQRENWRLNDGIFQKISYKWQYLVRKYNGNNWEWLSALVYSWQNIQFYDDIGVIMIINMI